MKSYRAKETFNAVSPNEKHIDEVVGQKQNQNTNGYAYDNDPPFDAPLKKSDIFGDGIQLLWIEVLLTHILNV